MAAASSIATAAPVGPSSLAGKTVLIFGGSSGMGLAAARAILAAGASVHIVGRDEAKLAAAKASLGADAKVSSTALDVMDDAAVEAFFGKFADGSFNHIVTTVGASARASDITGRAGFTKLKAQFDLKVFAQLSAVSFGAAKVADGGSIVLTSGALSKRVGKGSAALGAANAALEVAAKGLACDLGPRIRINVISPGLVDTEMWATLPAAVREGMLAGFGKEIPTGRAGVPDDIGHGIRFLLENNWVSGTTLDVDGGAAVRE